MEELNLTIPTDKNDFILLKCPKCGEYFKLYADDFKNRIKIDIHCPICGLISENYFRRCY